VQEGKVKVKEHLTEGIENAGKAFIEVGRQHAIFAHCVQPQAVVLLRKSLPGSAAALVPGIETQHRQHSMPWSGTLLQVPLTVPSVQLHCVHCQAVGTTVDFISSDWGPRYCMAVAAVLVI
jgi:hypothetical protein